MLKGDPLGFINIHSVAKYEKTRRGDPFETLFFFEKSRTVPKKIQRGDPLDTSGFVGFLEKVKWKGGPFGLSLPWPDLASGAHQVVSGLFLKSGPISVRIVVWRKTRRERLKSAPYLRLKKRKTLLLEKNWNFWKNFFFQKKSHSAEKCKRGDPSGFIKHSVAKYQKTQRGDPLGTLKNFRKKSHSAEKIQRGDPWGTSGFVGYVKKVKNERGDPLE